MKTFTCIYCDSEIDFRDKNDEDAPFYTENGDGPFCEPCYTIVSARDEELKNTYEEIRKRTTK